MISTCRREIHDPSRQVYWAMYGNTTGLAGSRALFLRHIVQKKETDLRLMVAADRAAPAPDVSIQRLSGQSRPAGKLPRAFEEL